MTLEDNIEVVYELEEGNSQRVIAKKFGTTVNIQFLKHLTTVDGISRHRTR